MDFIKHLYQAVPISQWRFIRVLIKVYLFDVKIITLTNNIVCVYFLGLYIYRGVCGRWKGVYARLGLHLLTLIFLFVS